MKGAGLVSHNPTKLTNHIGDRLRGGAYFLGTAKRAIEWTGKVVLRLLVATTVSGNIRLWNLHFCVSSRGLQGVRNLVGVCCGVSVICAITPGVLMRAESSPHD